MEYARAIGAESVKYVNALDCQMVTVVEGLDLSVVDLELRMQEVETYQGNYDGLQGMVVEVWGKVANTLDAVDNMEVDLDSLKEWMENVELVYMEVDQQVEQLEWELANARGMWPCWWRSRMLTRNSGFEQGRGGNRSGTWSFNRWT